MVYHQVRALLAEMEFLKQYNSVSELSDADLKDIDGKTLECVVQRTLLRTVKLIKVFFQLAMTSRRPWLGLSHMARPV